MLFSLFTALSFGDDQSDLPSRGRSAFDLFVAENGRVPMGIGEITADLERVTQQTYSKNLMIFSRSLARKEVTLENMRALLATSVSKNPNFMGKNLTYSKIAVGHMTSSGNYEVASINEKLGRPEFQRVISGKVSYVRRDLCMSCHQDGALLFVGDRWNESQANFENFEKIKETEYVKKLPAGWLNASSDSPKTLTAAAQASETFANGQRLWRESCGTALDLKVACRKLLLEHYANSITNNIRGSRLTYEEVFKTKEKTNFLTGFLSRKSEPETLLEKSWRKTWPKQGIYLRKTALLKDPERHELSHDRPLTEAYDPKTPRPGVYVVPHFDKGVVGFKDIKTGEIKDRTIYYFMGDFFGKSEWDALVTKVGGRTAMMKLLADGKFDQALAEDVFNFRSIILAAYRASGISTEGLQYPEHLEKALPPPVLENELMATVPNHVHGLRKYCGECHVGQEKNDFNFMNGSDEEIIQRLQNNKTLHDRVVSRLQPEPDHQMMPPPESERGIEFRKDLKQRKNLVSELENLKSVKLDCGIGSTLGKVFP